MKQNSGDPTDEAMLMEIGRLSARLIHDFKNQLGGMKLYASYLKKRFADNAEGVELADKIIETINEMAQHAALVSKLAQPVSLTLATQSVKPVLELAVNELAARARARAVSVRVELSDELPVIQIDGQQMKIALVALLARAIESASEGGLVSVSAQRSPASLLMSVTDDGAELDGEKLEALFDAVTHERINSISLGLAQARRIIREHGGRVTACAAIPQGITVAVELPLNLR